MEFTERLRKLLEMRGMTAAGLSRVAGVPKTTVYGILNGNIKPENVTVSNFLALAHALGVTADELYDGKPYTPPSSVDRRYSSLDREGRALVDIALDAAEARSTLKDAEVLGA